MKLLIMQSSPPSCHFFPLRSKCSSAPSVYGLPLVRETKFHTCRHLHSRYPNSSTVGVSGTSEGVSGHMRRVDVLPTVHLHAGECPVPFLPARNAGSQWSRRIPLTMNSSADLKCDVQVLEFGIAVQLITA